LAVSMRKPSRTGTATPYTLKYTAIDLDMAVQHGGVTAIAI
jgi:hypothetical protein